MATRNSRGNAPSLRATLRCPREQEINILLLGPTGVGKSTFINAFANYITYDKLDQAVDEQMQVVIPSVFTHTIVVNDAFVEQSVTMGFEDEHEKFCTEGQSCTQQCRSFVFPIGQRNLRLIDTPGIGDTRGIEQDEKNFREILTFISQYKHLNAVFVMLKPNEARLNVLFRFSVNELLRHLHADAKENLMFVFTNARSTFYMPGSSKKTLETLLNTHRAAYNVDIPFSKANSFMFDNESFRYLALHKNGVQLDEEQTRSYRKSWDYSVMEYARLMEAVNKCPLHAISSTVSLNEAQQLIRKLPRPMAETARLIQENIQLARDFQQKVLSDPSHASEGIPQNNFDVVVLKHPRTVCVGDGCCRVIDDGDEKRMEYLSICHDECYLTGVQQETLYDPKLQDCTAMEPHEGFCMVCDCHWLQHKHITYENKSMRVHVKPKKALTLAEIDKRISDLRREEREIQDVYKKLVQFLHANTMLPVNDDYVEYMEYFIREERMKEGAGAQNREVIENLLKMKEEYQSEMDRFKKAMAEQTKATNNAEIVKPEGIFDLVNTLYQLPISGEQIRQQVEGIKIGQEQSTYQREVYVDLPARADSSKVMLELRQIVSSP